MPDSSSTEKDRYVTRHLRFGWWSLWVFLSLGLALEALHGFKVGLYLDASNTSRRLMWTLAHAHGTLLALIHLGFSFTAQYCSGWAAPSRKLASRLLITATVLLPGGFFLAGAVTYGGDPGIAVIAVAAGGLILMVSVLLIAKGATAANSRFQPAAPKSKKKK